MDSGEKVRVKIMFLLQKNLAYQCNSRVAFGEPDFCLGVICIDSKINF